MQMPARTAAADTAIARNTMRTKSQARTMVNVYHTPGISHAKLFINCRPEYNKRYARLPLLRSGTGKSPDAVAERSLVDAHASFRPSRVGDPYPSALGFGCAVACQIIFRDTSLSRIGLFQLRSCRH